MNPLYIRLSKYFVIWDSRRFLAQKVLENCKFCCRSNVNAFSRLIYPYLLQFRYQLLGHFKSIRLESIFLKKKKAEGKNVTDKKAINWKCDGFCLVPLKSFFVTMPMSDNTNIYLLKFNNENTRERSDSIGDLPQANVSQKNSICFFSLANFGAVL